MSTEKYHDLANVFDTAIAWRGSAFATRGHYNVMEFVGVTATVSRLLRGHSPDLVVGYCEKSSDVEGDQAPRLDMKVFAGNLLIRVMGESGSFRIGTGIHNLAELCGATFSDLELPQGATTFDDWDHVGGAHVTLAFRSGATVTFEPREFGHRSRHLEGFLALVADRVTRTKPAA
jgi:hypothetical protein